MTAATQISFQKTFRYHHGNLRDALLAAAADILTTEGIDGLSLRALAKATGVTQAAPYSHFRDKDELLAAVAEKGFQRLAIHMAETAAGVNTPRDRIEKLILGYIEFSLQNKPLFNIMFGSGFADAKKFPTLAMTSGKSYALISAALSKAPNAADVRFVSLGIWSLCHGLTTLLVDGKIKPSDFGAATLQEFVQRNLDLFTAQIG